MGYYQLFVAISFICLLPCFDAYRNPYRGVNLSVYRRTPPLTKKIPGVFITCSDEYEIQPGDWLCINYNHKKEKLILNKIILARYPYTNLAKVKLEKAAKLKDEYKLEYYVGTQECYIEATVVKGKVKRIHFDACQVV